MNSAAVRQAMKDALHQLRNLEPAELRRQIETHIDGPIASLLIESGMFEGRVLEAKARKDIFNNPTGYSLGMYYVPEIVDELLAFRFLSSTVLSSGTLESSVGELDMFSMKESEAEIEKVGWAA